jgi:methyltransferase (TIGR00027 family)
METRRPDAIFKDPFAERLAGPEGRTIVGEMKRGKQMAWAMIVRTAVFDEIILERIKSGGVDLVLNLAAGIDARPWRMNLPPNLRWIDVDLPDILNYKTDMLRDETPRCRYEAITTDLADAAKRQALFAQVGREASRVLVVSEGLLVYLTAEQVGELAADLHAQPSFRWWLIDLASAQLLVFMKRLWGKNVEAGNAPFKFGPAESTKFFERFGWRELSFRSATDDSIRLKRTMPFMRVWRFIGRIGTAKKREEARRFSGNVLLERV